MSSELMVLIAASAVAAFLASLVSYVRSILAARKEQRELERARRQTQRTLEVLTELKPSPEQRDQRLAAIRRSLAELEGSVTLAYKHADGTYSELRLEPTNERSISTFLDAIRAEEAVRSTAREPTAPAR